MRVLVYNILSFAFLVWLCTMIPRTHETVLSAMAGLLASFLSFPLFRPICIQAMEVNQSTLVYLFIVNGVWAIYALGLVVCAETIQTVLMQ